MGVATESDMGVATDSDMGVATESDMISDDPDEGVDDGYPRVEAMEEGGVASPSLQGCGQTFGGVMLKIAKVESCTSIPDGDGPGEEGSDGNGPGEEVPGGDGAGEEVPDGDGPGEEVSCCRQLVFPDAPPLFGSGSAAFGVKGLPVSSPGHMLLGDRQVLPPPPGCGHQSDVWRPGQRRRKLPLSILPNQQAPPSNMMSYLDTNEQGIIDDTDGQGLPHDIVDKQGLPHQNESQDGGRTRQLPMSLFTKPLPPRQWEAPMPPLIRDKLPVDVPGGGASADIPGGGASADVPGGGASADVPGGGASADVPGGGASADDPGGGASSQRLGENKIRKKSPDLSHRRLTCKCATGGACWVGLEDFLYYPEPHSDEGGDILDWV